MNRTIAILVAVSGIVTSSKADIVDLTPGAPASGGPLNGGFVFAIDPQSTGTGVIDPFLREQNNGSEQGINTSIANPPLDDKPGPWTHDLTVGQLATVTFSGNSYYKFTLDANQVGNGPISLTAFKIFVTAGSPFTSASDLTSLVSTGTPKFDMNGGSTQYRVDISSQNGSGSGDMYFLVPTSDIDTTGNLYLYAAFGKDSSGGGFESNDGFEEWYATEGQSTTTVPDAASSLMLLGMGFMGLEAFRRKLKF